MTKKYTSLEHSIRNIFSGDKTGSTENKSMEHNARLIHEAKTNQLTPQKTPGGQSPAYTEHSGFTGVFKSQSQNSSAAANEARRKPYTTGATMTEDGGKKNNKTKKFEEQAAVATAYELAPYLGTALRYGASLGASLLAAPEVVPAAATVGAGLIGKRVYDYVHDPENIKNAEAERAGEAQAGAEWDKKIADRAAAGAAMRRQAVDDADVAKDSASKNASAANPIDTPTPKTDKSIAIGADELGGTKIPPVAPVKTGVSPGAITAPVKTGVSPGAITAPVTSGAASDAVDKASSASKVTSQTQAKAAEASQTATPETAKPFRFPSFGSGTNTGTTAHSEYHTVPVQTSISQAANHRSFREEYNNAPDYTRRKNSSKELVGRPNSAPLKSAKSVLGRNAAIKAKIIDEEKKMASVIKSVIKKKKEESESGANPLVDFHPKINHKYDNQS